VLAEMATHLDLATDLALDLAHELKCSIKVVIPNENNSAVIIALNKRLISLTDDYWRC
jgi:hypothetical protein